MLEHSAHYIAGKWQPSNGRDTIAVVNAATEEVIGSISRPGNAEGMRIWPYAPPGRRSRRPWSTTSLALERCRLSEARGGGAGNFGADRNRNAWSVKKWGCLLRTATWPRSACRLQSFVSDPPTLR